jgi:hypothetical protein
LLDVPANGDQAARPANRARLALAPSALASVVGDMLCENPLRRQVITVLNE